VCLTVIPAVGFLWVIWNAFVKVRKKNHGRSKGTLTAFHALTWFTHYSVNAAASKIVTFVVIKCTYLQEKKPARKYVASKSSGQFNQIASSLIQEVSFPVKCPLNSKTYSNFLLILTYSNFLNSNVLKLPLNSKTYSNFNQLLQP
jgi:hypothetical protein